MAFFEDYGSDFEFFYRSELLPGNMPIKHLHPHYEALLILDPIPCEIFVNQTSIAVKPPFFALFTPHNLHKSFFTKKTEFERFVFYFGNKMIKDYADCFQAFLEKTHQHTAIIFEFTSEIEQKLRAILAPYDPSKMTLTEQKLVFLLILNTMLNCTDECKHTHFYEQNDYISHLLKYMCEHYNEPLTLDSLAEQFFVSRSKLSQDFKTHTGTSPHQFLLDIRIARAILYIRSGKFETVRDVANEVGFGNGLHFYSAFKKLIGMTPLEYAMMHKVSMRALKHKSETLSIKKKIEN
jgi:AraC-like DNA-binding protein